MAYGNLATPARNVCRLNSQISQDGTFVHYPFFLYWTFLYWLFLIGIFLRYLLVLTYFDSSRQHTHATTHTTGTQIVRAKMTSLEMTFCRGNKLSSRSPLSCRRKHKKSTARASRSWKTMSSTCKASLDHKVKCPHLYTFNWGNVVLKLVSCREMSSFIHFQLRKRRIETCFLSSVASDARIVMNWNLKKWGM